MKLLTCAFVCLVFAGTAALSQQALVVAAGAQTPPATAPTGSAASAKPVTDVAMVPDLPTIFIAAQPGFETALTAAFTKKQVPALVTVDKAHALYSLEAADVFAHQESAGSKVARCLFLDCIGMEGTASTSVRLVRNADGVVVWAYQVRKANGGPAGIQSLSEATAKHLKNDYLNKKKG